jgi:hypothetical protein
MLGSYINDEKFNFVLMREKGRIKLDAIETNWFAMMELIFIFFSNFCLSQLLSCIKFIMKLKDFKRIKQLDNTIKFYKLLTKKDDDMP